MANNEPLFFELEVIFFPRVQEIHRIRFEMRRRGKINRTKFGDGFQHSDCVTRVRLVFDELPLLNKEFRS